MLTHHRSRVRSLAALAPCVLLCTAVLSAQPSKRVFPDRVTVDDTALAFNGQGLCEWGFFAIDLYWGALYLEKPAENATEVIRSRQKKRIHLYFVRSLSRAQLQKAFTAAVEYNTGKRVSRYRAPLAKLCGMMNDVEEKQSIVFDYVPDKGLRVSFNGKRRGWIASEPFARLFFRLYFGKHPPDENLKRGMLKSRTR